MLFWIFMTAMAALTPLTMVLLGARFEKKPPKRNSIIGYKTAMSSKNDDTWDFAQRFIGRLWRNWGWVTLVASLAAMVLYLNKDMEAMGYAGLALVFVQMVPLIGSIIATERALRNTFDRFGQRKE